MLPSTVPMIFDYKDPKGISAVSLALDAPLEPIVGYAKGISGTVRFDPAHPERSEGRLAVNVDSVQFANDGYTATARGYALNGKRWPQLTLTVRRLENVRRLSATRFAGTVVADFTCRGVTRSKRLVGTADYFPGRAEERTNGQHKGDLLVLRTRFSVSRKEHGISDGIPDSLVGDTVEVGVAVVGIHYAEAPPEGDPLREEPRGNVEKAEAGKPSTARTSPTALALPRYGGGTLSLDAARSGGTLVAFFLNEQCGVTVHYRERLRRLEREFGAKGFRFVAVRTGRKTPPVVLPERTYLRMPFLDDADGVLMRRFGVGQSMTFVVLDRAGRLRYQGGLDDSVDPARVRRTPLRDALVALAAGRPVRVPRAQAVGCAILPVEP